jgi:hypothetical protein
MRFDDRENRMRTRLFVVVLMVFSLIGISFISGIKTDSAFASSDTLTFPAAAEAVVDSSQPVTVVGSQSGLMTDGAPEIDSYLRFNVSGLSGPAASAILQVTSGGVSGIGYLVRSVANNGWDPSSLTFANAPAMGESLGSSGAFGAGEVTSVDVTLAITGNGTFSFALTSADPLPVSYIGPAQLVIIPPLVKPTLSVPGFGTLNKTGTPGFGGSGAFPGATPIPPVGGSGPTPSKTDEPDRPGQP